MAREITRQSNGSGKIAKSALRAAFRRFRIAYHKQHFYRLLHAGNGRYWTIDDQFIYLTGYKNVARNLSLLAEQEDPRLIETNRPGVPDVYVNIAGSLEQFEAAGYSAWLYYRDYPTISREVLSHLFGRTAETIRRWESTRLSQIVTKRSNYAQCSDLNDYPYPLPYHANSYVAKVGKRHVVRVRWQLPNTYFAKGIKQHRHRGQSQKVRRTVNHELQQPAKQWRGGLLGCKLYFDSPTKLQGYTEKYGGARYLWLDQNQHGHGLFEATSSGITETQARERESFWRERELMAIRGLKLTV